MNIWSLLLDSILTITTSQFVRLKEDEACSQFKLSFSIYWTLPMCQRCYNNCWQCKVQQNTDAALMSFAEKEERRIRGSKITLLYVLKRALCTLWCLNTEEPLNHIVQWSHEAHSKRWQLDWRDQEERKAKQGRECKGRKHTCKGREAWNSADE